MARDSMLAGIRDPEDARRLQDLVQFYTTQSPDPNKFIVLTWCSQFQDTETTCANKQLKRVHTITCLS